MELNTEEQAHYSRHILLQEIELEGQLRLKAAKVLVIGAGGLGCPILQYLAAAGVGTLGVIDMDVVEVSNLQRQILYTTQDVGKAKVHCAKARLEQMNPHIQVQAYYEQLTSKNTLALFEQYDIIVDGSDNFATRYLVNDAALIRQKPLVYGAIFKFEGQVAVFNYQVGPSYRCLFPEPPAAGSVPNCSEVGVLGVLPGIIGGLQANEVLKMILGIGQVLSGKLLVYNLLTHVQTILQVAPNAKTIEAVLAKASSFEQQNYEQFCGIKSRDEVAQLSAAEFDQNISAYTIVDVRELWEQPRIEAWESIDIPLPRMLLQTQQIPKDQPVVIVCAKGIRSQIAIQQLQQKHHYQNLFNLTGGIKAWKAWKTKQASSLASEVKIQD